MKDPFKFVISIILCQAAGLISSPFSTPSILSWYPSLKKPPLTPPGGFIGPVWFVLYFLMGVSFYLVWTAPAKKEKVASALYVFLFQLFLNAIWSFIFFTFRAPSIALVDIALLWFAIIATILKFRPISVPATLLLVPYFLWVTFAVYLNLGIVLLNP